MSTRANLLYDVVAPARDIWDGGKHLALTRALFDRLVDDYSASLYRVAFRLVGDPHEAEDLVQETYRSAWNSRKQFDVSRGGKAWLITILRRRAADHWRRQKPMTIGFEEALDRQIDGGQPTEDGYCDEVQKALEQLPDALRETLLLVAVAELTHQEAANLLNVPLGTVLSRVSRARSRMRTALASQLDRLG